MIDTVSKTFAEYRGRLLKFIRSRVRAQQDAEDIMQDVFYNFARVNELANPVEQTAAWLYRAARNKIIDHYKKKKDISFSDLEEEDDDDSGDEYLSDFIDILAGGQITALNSAQTRQGQGSPAETETIRAFVWDEILNAVDELPRTQRDIFIQTEFEGLPVKEISEKTGVPVNTLLSRKHYAVMRLRDKLRDIYEDLTGG